MMVLLHFFTFNNYLIFSFVFFSTMGASLVDYSHGNDLCIFTIYINQV